MPYHQNMSLGNMPIFGKCGLQPREYLQCQMWIIRNKDFIWRRHREQTYRRLRHQLFLMPSYQQNPLWPWPDHRVQGSVVVTLPCLSCSMSRMRNNCPVSIPNYQSILDMHQILNINITASSYLSRYALRITQQCSLEMFWCRWKRLDRNSYHHLVHGQRDISGTVVWIKSFWLKNFESDRISLLIVVFFNLSKTLANNPLGNNWFGVPIQPTIVFNGSMKAWNVYHNQYIASQTLSWVHYATVFSRHGLVFQIDKLNLSPSWMSWYFCPNFCVRIKWLYTNAPLTCMGVPFVYTVSLDTYLSCYYIHAGRYLLITPWTFPRFYIILQVFRLGSDIDWPHPSNIRIRRRWSNNLQTYHLEFGFLVTNNCCPRHSCISFLLQPKCQYRRYLHVWTQSFCQTHSWPPSSVQSHWSLVQVSDQQNCRG